MCHDLQHRLRIVKGTFRRIINPIKTDDLFVVIERHYHKGMDILTLQILVLERVRLPNILQIMDHDVFVFTKVPIPVCADFSRQILKHILCRHHPICHPLIGIVIVALRIPLKNIGTLAF